MKGVSPLPSSTPATSLVSCPVQHARYHEGAAGLDLVPRIKSAWGLLPAAGSAVKCLDLKQAQELSYRPLTLDP